MIIDFDLVTTSKIMTDFGGYSGGTNYALELIESLIAFDKSMIHSFQVLVAQEKEDWIKTILPMSENVQIIPVDNLLNYLFDDTDILILPQVNGTLLGRIGRIHKINPKMKIYGTLHDKQHNISRYDYYDGYYSQHRIITNIGNRIVSALKVLAFAFVYIRNVSLLDKVFTVSNYSAQKLLGHSLKRIFIYIQTNRFEKKTRNSYVGDYLLFVGGNRPEKNLFRTLEAYCQYIKIHPEGERLIVTGMSDDIVKLFFKNKKLDKKILGNNVEFKGYVSDAELADLYSECKYVLFLSKGEGYGLPILEAMSYGKTVLASRVTAIPEVGGASIKYVDPYSVESIKEGLEFFLDKANVIKYSLNAEKKYELISKMAKLDKDLIAAEFLSVR